MIWAASVYYVKDFDPSLWRIAEERAAGMPVYTGSHRGKAANQVGALGEVLFEYLLTAHGISFVPRYETTEDLEVCGDTIDVKTKDRTVAPRRHYECSVPLYNHEHQRPAIYVFVSLLRSKFDKRTTNERFTKAFIVGWCTLGEIDAKGTLKRTNEVDRSNGTRFWTACKNLAISDLNPMADLLGEYALRSGRGGRSR